MKLSTLAVAVFASLGMVGGLHAAGDIAAGKAKAAGCAACHGANGEGKAPAPALAGIHEEVMKHELMEYKSGQRKHAGMKMISSPLSEQDMENLGAYYASLKKK
jgi:cytochrome c553